MMKLVNVNHMSYGDIYTFYYNDMKYLPTKGDDFYKFLIKNEFAINGENEKLVDPGFIELFTWSKQPDEYGVLVLLIQNNKNVYYEDKNMRTWPTDRDYYQRMFSKYIYGANDIKAPNDARKMNYTAKDSNYCANDIKATEEVTKMNYNECSKKEPTPHKKQMRHICEAKAMLGATGITKVIFNDMATIVFWRDGSKTVVKCMECDFYSKETAIAIAYFKHSVGDEYYHYVMDALTGNKGEKVLATTRAITIKGY